jgi:hypothetical protein
MRQDTEIRRLKQQGVADDDLQLAMATQESQRRLGSGAQSLEDILAGRAAPKPRRSGVDVVPLSDRQMRRRGLPGQAALVAFQAAEHSDDPEQKRQCLKAAEILRAATRGPVQLEFNFFKENWSVSSEYLDAVMTRLQGKPHELEAWKVLVGLMRFVDKHDPECKFGTQEKLAGYVGMRRQHVTRALSLLEAVGAIRRVKEGRGTRVYINPEGIYRGDMNKHAETVAKFAKVVELHPREPA